MTKKIDIVFDWVSAENPLEMIYTLNDVHAKTPIKSWQIIRVNRKHYIAYFEYKTPKTRKAK